MLPVFWETFLLFCSLVNEILFLNNLLYWVIEWRNLIPLFMKESVFITRIVYGLYSILLGIFGILLGFLLGVYNRDEKIEEIYVFLLLLLLKILHNNGFDDVLLEPNKAEQFSKFSLKTIEPINPRPLKITLKEPDQIPQIPLTIFSYPFVSIDIDFTWEESKSYKFELFKFYRSVNERVKISQQSH